MKFLAGPALAALTFALLASPAMAQDRATGLKLDSNKPIQIESNNLEVREAENVAIFTGNVAVQQDKTVLKAGRMKVYYKKDSGSATTGSADIDRLEVDGKVYVRSEEQEATADKGTYDMTSQLLVLSGDKVVLTEGSNIIVGCRLTVKTDTGLAQLEPCKSTGGRVKMLLTPGEARKKTGN
ncbi:LPS ABC transporter substrate-binding protein LptA [Zhengella mangrovi]|uniref:LPS ABC transporter substrate-binding protein LptA n=1 Tax=Zhengella mangrovi TaxID=1982044 RepID=A0A2G1QTB5_9HYPH|nr:LptA/OstA family protein [Zhengella mangrovi]PHP68721.1 LPS ABC transporter substrate-binding protein LptA [Zhengella mangrovi]